MTRKDRALPSGQIEREDFPRFGMTTYADFVPDLKAPYTLSIGGVIEAVSFTEAVLQSLPRYELTADFHCVTTWSYRHLTWGGFRFRDFYNQQIAPHIPDEVTITQLVIRGQDKYKTSLPLADALADEVLIADTLNGQPLSAKHGAPYRFVAPAHYGYKNVKHLHKIDCWPASYEYKPAIRFMDHPRARVAFEERGRYFPGWLLRYVYRPLIGRTVKKFQRAEENSKQTPTPELRAP